MLGVVDKTAGSGAFSLATAPVSAASASSAAPTSSAAPSAGTVAAGRRCRPRRAAASPARTAGRSGGRRPPIPAGRTRGRGVGVPAGSTPRSAQRASRSLVGWRTGGGERRTQLPRPARVRRPEVSGQRFADDAVLLGAGDQTWRRVAGALAAAVRSTEKAWLCSETHQLAHHGRSLTGTRAEQPARQLTRTVAASRPDPVSSRTDSGRQARRDVRRITSISSVLLPVPGPPRTRTVPRAPGAARRRTSGRS